MKTLLCENNTQTVIDEPDPAIPDADLMARFRSMIGCGTVTNLELYNTLDTRYLQPHLYLMARTLHAKTIVEIGVGRGGSTFPLLKAAAEMGGTLYCVDPAMGAQQYAHELAVRYNVLDHIKHFVGTSDDFFTWSNTPAQIDFAFVDGNHECAYVERDIRNVLDRLTPGSSAVFHEYADVQNIPPWERMEPWGNTSPPELGGLDCGTPRAFRRVLSAYDVDVMPLDFGVCGKDRVNRWTEGGAMIIRKRHPGEFRVIPQ